MAQRLGLAVFIVTLSATGQTPSELSRHFRDVQSTPEGVKAAEEWLQTYEQQPDSTSRPPYLTVAQFYAARGVNTDQIPALLEKASQEIATVGGYTDIRTQTYSPFANDIDRCLIANVYTQVRLYDKAHAILETVSQRMGAIKSEILDSTKARIFQALLFSYRDASVRLAIAEGRSEDALVTERAILTNSNNVASSRLLEEHRTMAMQLWTQLGRSQNTFQAWLATAR
jgi:hypothetical protein